MDVTAKKLPKTPLVEAVEKVRKFPLDWQDRQAVEKLLKRVRLPMSVVLAAIQGDTLEERCSRARVRRQTWWRWETGRTRPSKPQALWLAKITGYSAVEIRGRD